MDDKDTLRIVTTTICVLAGIFAVVLILTSLILRMPVATQMDQMKDALEVAAVAVGTIGTLVGFIAGHTAGANGKESAQNRADAAVHDMHMAEMKSAVLHTMAPYEIKKRAWQEHPDMFDPPASPPEEIS